MFKLIFKKELLSIIKSPKFIGTFLTCTLLILLSVYIGIQEYNNAIRQYNTSQQLFKSQTEQIKSWHSLRTTEVRKPDPLMIFTAGVHNDVGRYSQISQREEVKLQNSVYMDDPIFAIFRFIDFTFIVTVILSLFAILFTYNSINGEKESGTSRLIFSNSVSRIQFLLAKIAGALTGLIIPILIPILISILLILLLRIDFTLNDWSRLFVFITISLLYFVFFTILGVSVSAFTKSSSNSFLFLLVFWITSIFIVPRIGVMTAGQFVKVISQAEIDSQLDAYSKDRWNEFYSEMNKVWELRNAEMESLDENEREAYRDSKTWSWMQQDDLMRKKIEKEINEYSLRLNEGFVNKKYELKNLAFTLSRFSPSSSYQLAAMNIAKTDIEMKQRYESLLRDYRTRFLGFVETKEAEEGESSGRTISFNSETGISINDGRKESGIDLSEMPKFVYPNVSFSQILNPTIIDFGIISFYTLIILAIGYLRFLKFDLR